MWLVSIYQQRECFQILTARLFTMITSDDMNLESALFVLIFSSHITIVLRNRYDVMVSGSVENPIAASSVV